MEINQDLSLLSMVVDASLLVQIVMIVLVLMSLVSWSHIFRKTFAIRDAIKQTKKFENEFWSGTSLNVLFEEIAYNYRNKNKTGALERIFMSGMEEFRKARLTYNDKNFDVSAIVEGSRRAMRASYQREMDSLESNLAFLASVGSVSPYIGLFGTVWGIMNSFRSLANVRQATLAAVAPGIAEALVATAIGLFAAIPAVIAYNRYINEIDRLSIKFNSFIEEFSNILQRQAK